MNKQEAVKLLAMIKIAYPSAYRDTDDKANLATVNMWHISFPDVPFPIMEQAFNRYRMTNKFPPTVAEMAQELHHIYNQAVECALTYKTFGDREAEDRYRAVMAYTARFQNLNKLGGLNIEKIPALNGGGGNAAAPGNKLDRSDRLSLMDAGEGRT